MNALTAGDRRFYISGHRVYAKAYAARSHAMSHPSNMSSSAEGPSLADPVQPIE
jgi:hypothetical protein